MCGRYNIMSAPEAMRRFSQSTSRTALHAAPPAPQTLNPFLHLLEITQPI